MISDLVSDLIILLLVSAGVVGGLLAICKIVDWWNKREEIKEKEEAES